MRYVVFSATLFLHFTFLKPAQTTLFLHFASPNDCGGDKPVKEEQSCEVDSDNVNMLRSIDFEVFGRVQGVFFRKHTIDKAKQLGLKGWVMNTRHNTVIGTAQGDGTALEEMKHWLSHIGSPQSKIDRCDFKNEKQLSSLEFKDFAVKH